MVIEIEREKLLKLLLAYFPWDVEACPFNAEAFCDVLATFTPKECPKEKESAHQT
jgi:hypothetical protein